MVMDSQVFRIADMSYFLGEKEILPPTVCMLINPLLASEVLFIMVLPYFMVILIENL